MLPIMLRRSLLAAILAVPCLAAPLRATEGQTVVSVIRPVIRYSGYTAFVYWPSRLVDVYHWSPTSGWLYQYTTSY